MGIFSRWSLGYNRFYTTPEWNMHLPEGWQNDIMSLQITDRLHEKQGRSIARYTINPHFVVYLKRHYCLSFWVGLRSVFFPNRPSSPGIQEWHHLKIAKNLEIPVPEAVAAGEWLKPHARLSSFIAIKELSDQIPLHEAIPVAYQHFSSNDFRLWKNGLIHELVRLTHLFHSRNYFHRDWYLCHFYIHRQYVTTVPFDWKGKITVIDLHRMTYQPLRSLLYRSKDIAQLLYSSTSLGISNRDRIQFWLLYSRRLKFKSLLKFLILKKWKFYQRHDRPNG